MTTPWRPGWYQAKRGPLSRPTKVHFYAAPDMPVCNRGSAADPERYATMENYNPCKRCILIMHKRYMEEGPQ